MNKKPVYPTAKGVNCRLNGHTGAVFWFMGLPSSGKTTLVKHAEKLLIENDHRVMVLDGDILRRDITTDLGFSKEDRSKNIEIAAKRAASFFNTYGYIVLCSFITPFKQNRNDIHEIMKDIPHYLIYCSCSIEKCQERDVKGLYAKAACGEITEMTGIDSPFEEPDDPDFIINTEQPFDVCSEAIMDFILMKTLRCPQNKEGKAVPPKLKVIEGGK